MDHKMNNDRYADKGKEQRDDRGRDVRVKKSTSSMDDGRKDLWIGIFVLIAGIVLLVIAFSGPSGEEVVQANSTPLSETAEQQSPTPEPTPIPTPDPFAEKELCELDPAPAGTGQVDIVTPQPLMFRIGKDVYITNGENVVQLPDASIVLMEDEDEQKLNGVLTGDNKAVYYQASPDLSGVGKLMKLGTDCTEEPEVVIEKMRTAMFSDDGSHILYAPKSNENNEVDLHLFDGDKSKRIVRNALDKHYGISGNGENIYYYLTETDVLGVNLLLYRRLGDSEHKRLETFDKMTSVYDFGMISNSGSVYYECSKMFSFERKSYLYTNQKNTLSTDGSLLYTLGDIDNMLILKDHYLYYRHAGGKREKTQGDCRGAVYPQYVGGDIEYIPELRWIIAYEDIGFNVRYAEQPVDGEPVDIAVGDWDSGEVNADFTWFKYTLEGELFLNYKTADGWSDAISLSPDIKSGCFDTAGEYYWFINDTDDLYRFSLKRGTLQLIQQGVQEVRAVGHHVYTMTNDNMLYVTDKDNEMCLLQENIDDFMQPMGKVVCAKTYGKMEGVM